MNFQSENDTRYNGDMEASLLSKFNPSVIIAQEIQKRYKGYNPSAPIEEAPILSSSERRKQQEQEQERLQMSTATVTTVNPSMRSIEEIYLVEDEYLIEKAKKSFAKVIRDSTSTATTINSSLTSIGAEEEYPIEERKSSTKVIQDSSLCKFDPRKKVGKEIQDNYIGNVPSMSGDAVVTSSPKKEQNKQDLLIDTSKKTIQKEIEGLEGGDTGEDEFNLMLELPDDIVCRVERLKNLNDVREKQVEEYLKERAALEIKYQALYEPLLNERAAVVRGERDDAIELAALVRGERDEDPGTPGTVARGIPRFWVIAMDRVEEIGSLVTEEDVACLEHLEDISCADDPDGRGFALRFSFSKNDYFHDTVLTKKYEVPNLLTDGEPVLKNISGCTIQWKSGRSLTYRSVQKKQRGKGKCAGRVRVVTRKKRKESFFHWFDPPSVDGTDREEAEKLEELFDRDYKVAQAFRLHVIPKGVLWFTGEAADH